MSRKRKPAKKKQPRWLSYLFLSINTVTSAALFIMVKPSLEIITPTRFLFYRFGFAILFSLPIAFYFLQKRYRKKLPQYIKTIIPYEILGTVIPLFLIYQGLSRVAALDANLLFTIQPVLITAISVWWLKEREESHELLGLLLAFGATLTLILLPILETGEALSNSSLIGNVLIFASIMFISTYYPLVKRAYKNVPKFLVTTTSFYPGFLVFAGWAFVEQQLSFSQLTATIAADFSHVSVWVAAIYSSLFGAIIAWTAYILGQNGIEASEATLFSYLQPLVYIPLGFLVLGETITFFQAFLLFLILTGVFIAEKRWQRKQYGRLKR